MTLYNDIKEDAYYDSVSLMVLSSNLTAIPGVKNAAVMMGTTHNKELMEKIGLFNPDQQEATSNDLIIGVHYDDQTTLSEATSSISQFFDKKETSSSTATATAKSLETAHKLQPHSNLAIISVPGIYAKNEALKALNQGLHVLLFSDNVTIEEEIELKEKAIQKDLLMMGPDCGTVLLNGVALGFANEVKRGNIGIVAAAGTGLQEVSVIIDRLSGGVSQGIGTGGRDIKAEVGGLMMLKGLDMLEEDDQTEVIVIVSKSPAPEVMEKVIKKVEMSKKKIVACLLGGDTTLIKNGKIIPTVTLEDAASFAVALSEDRSPESTFFSKDMSEIKAIVDFEVAKMKPEQQYIRGLYSGGTLCYEAILILRETLGDVYSNVPLKEKLRLVDVLTSKEHTLLDMGEDYFTEGLPHPMIDPRHRVARIKEEAADEEVAVMILDVVLGYGAHENPAGVLAEAIQEAREIAAKDGHYISFVASICGTDYDIQNKEEQERFLKQAGVIVMPSNAQAVRMASLLAAKGEGLEKMM